MLSGCAVHGGSVKSGVDLDAIEFPSDTSSAPENDLDNGLLTGPHAP
jgi:hypothetical protein